ncbi:caspase domain-containing protein [Irpex lacteus]|nr:caspase domain-containing protein [Irpex lacteus]
MMWDLGGQTYVPGSSPPQGSSYPPQGSSYQPQQSTYPAYPQEPAPFAPMGRPMSQMNPVGYDNSYAYDSSYQSTPPASMPRAISDPGNGMFTDTTRSAPIIHSSHSGRTHIHVHSSSRHYSEHRSHSHSHSRPHRESNAQSQSPPHRLTHQQPPPAQQHASHASSHTWAYSKCTGHKKALCIGINYTGTQHELHGCVNDAKNMRKFLISQWGYKAEDIVLLTDDASLPRAIPTRANMIDAMRWLVKDAHQHDSLFFHYSGHGSQVKDRDGDEIDGYDEVILPLDFARAGYISDDLMHQIMVKPLPIGCRLTALFDSCHSGSALDLPYLYHTNGRAKGSQVSDKFFEARYTPADVISLSGCQDNQTSADTYASGGAVGAMSHAFMTSLRQTPNQTYQELLRSVRFESSVSLADLHLTNIVLSRKILHDKYDQKPQLSASHHIDTSLRFIM